MHNLFIFSKVPTMLKRIAYLYVITNEIIYMSYKHDFSKVHLYGRCDDQQEENSYGGA